jgi:pimeloyl-ACP methyl ester carboxylesterase
VSQDAAGAKVLSSGLVFAPRAGTIPAEGRPVVAWAHPTVGMGDQCAPSRTPDVESDVPGLANFLASGWVVAATDYAGLGTAGTEQYLVGLAEAHDVLNSVRAARGLEAAHAGARVAIFGHSQGGQAALWAADQAPYAPELSVVAVAAAAPAAELVALIDHQWSTIYGSLIGAEVLVSFPHTYPDLKLSSITHRPAEKVVALADRCIQSAAIDIVAAKVVGEGPLIDRNPLDDPRWRAALASNTPPVPTVPTLLVQGTDDPIVLPGTNALFVRRACGGGRPMTADFVGKLGHMKAGMAAAPFTYTWFQQRFAGVPATSTCGTRLPVPVLG